MHNKNSIKYVDMPIQERQFKNKVTKIFIFYITHPISGRLVSVRCGALMHILLTRITNSFCMGVYWKFSKIQK